MTPLAEVARMREALQANGDWASLPLFDRTGWTRVPFGGFADSINERVEPTNAADEIYVGLEHLDPGSLHIRRWGKGSDVIGTKLRFRKGDIIFGRRRAYQRKLAVAEFDGICSAHAMVVRAKADVILPEFLPFLMMSDRFMKRAVEISVGSLSPTINWTTLKREEFDLPPLDQQRRLSEVFWRLDISIQALGTGGEAAAQAQAAQVEALFDAAAIRNSTRPLSELADVAYGLTLDSKRTQLPIQKPYLRVANVQRASLDLGEVKQVGCTTADIAKYQLVDGDVLIVEGHADVRQIGRAAVWRDSGTVTLHQNHLLRVRCGPELSPDYLELYLNSLRGRAYFQSTAKSTSGLNTINSTITKKCPIPTVSIERQLEALDMVRTFQPAAAAWIRQQEACANLLDGVSREIFACPSPKRTPSNS